MKKKSMNSEDWRVLISDVITELRKGKTTIDVAKTVINASGKSVSNAVAQMNYDKWMGERKRIEFFNVDSEVLKDLKTKAE
jgi:hypothetical protein